MEICLQISSDLFLVFHADVVPPDILFLHGFDVLRPSQMTLGFAYNSLRPFQGRHSWYE